MYNNFISNNHTLFNLRWKENVQKHQKVSKLYDNYCLQKFVLSFLLLVTTPVVRNSHIQARFYFIFLKNILKPTWNRFNNKFWSQSKCLQTSYQVRQVWALLWNLIALILNWNCVKCLGVTKIFKEIKSEEDFGELGARKFPRN